MIGNQVVATIQRRFISPYGMFGNWSTAHLSVGGKRFKVTRDVSGGGKDVYDSTPELWQAIIDAAAKEKARG
jgi:predicted NAD-dependent protein-ADP-ribosyltransferase YbiA (DUF1768 family)